ncbi:MAG: helix-turn-helix domain-containing protein [Phycisphaerales bacterium]|nr:helix-turn-helix domain-containing protein [Phycisphaerales bacterium]
MAVDIYTIPEAASRLGISPRRLRRLIGSGAIRVLRAGPHIRITETALSTYQSRPQKAVQP